MDRKGALISTFPLSFKIKISRTRQGPSVFPTEFVFEKLFYFFLVLVQMKVETKMKAIDPEAEERLR